MKSTAPLSQYAHLKIGLILLAYMTAISLISFFHEIWRDEAVLINILLNSSSLWDFYAQTQNYGHPRLWHILVYFSYQISPHYSVLKILNVTICGAAMFVFLKFSPFKLWQKILFMLGVFPIYIYPAFSRSYGLCMLLIFLLASLYKDRWTRIIPVSATLVLLANTHAHTLIITIAVICCLMIELIRTPSLRSLKNISVLIFITIGIILSIIQIIPDPTINLTLLHAITIPAILQSFVTAIFFPGKIFNLTFGVSALFSNIVIYTTAVFLWNKKHLWIIFTLSTIGLVMFSILFYPSDGLRHQGSLFLIFIFCLWSAIDEDATKPSHALSPFTQHLKTHQNAYIAVLLILQICAAYPAVRKDILNPYSSSKALSVFLSQHPELNGAIFIPEPDYLLESAPYYKPDIRIFLSRESVFRSYTRFTQESQSTLTLEKILADGESIKNKQLAPVIFVIGHSLPENGSATITMANHRTFSISQESLEQFRSKTHLIAEFHDALSDENYSLYLLNEDQTP